MVETTSANTLTMKLLVDTKAQRVLFAEAGKDVVDFLFSLLALPAATTVKLVGEESMVGSVGNLYASVENLDSTYVQTGATKDKLLSPTVDVSPTTTTNSALLGLPPPPAPPAAKPKTFYRCTNTHSYSSAYCRSYITDVHGHTCPNCSNQMTTAAQYVSSADSGRQAVKSAVAGKGFVQGIVTYTVLDNLTISPMSAISSITLLNTFAVRDLGDLKEKTVQIGYKEGVEILKSSLQSTTVLTDVFLGKKKASPPAGV